MGQAGTGRSSAAVRLSLQGLLVATVVLTSLGGAAAIPLQVQLVNRGNVSAVEGRVEVRRWNNETWGTVCGSLWGPQDAAVVCRQVDPQFQWGEYYPYNSPYGTGSGPIYLTSLQCRGNETNLGDCQAGGWGDVESWCRHDYDIAVKCNRYKVRLRPQRGGYENAQYGAVEVLQQTDYTWLSVCDSLWDDNDARVVCRSLGFPDGVAQCCGKLTTRYPYSYHGIIQSVNCTGNEDSFDACTYSRLRSFSASCPSGLASAICYHTSRSALGLNDFELRLGNNTWGRVEVKHLGVWGAVCAGTSFNNSAASIICRQQTSRGGGVVMGISTNDYFRGSGWVTQLNCSGSESSIEQCVVEWGSPSYTCRPQYVLCYTQTAPKVSLAGGSGPSNGRVEITMDGTTYTICSDENWRQTNADVTCRSLGYGGGQALKNSYYGSGAGMTALSSTSCVGTELDLLQCTNNGWLVANADCSGDLHHAAVYCYGRVRLLLGDHSNGILQVSVYSTGQWINNYMYQTVCGTGFSDEDAKVACRDVGFFNNGRALAPGSYGSFASSLVWRNLSCSGSERSIFNCTYDSGACVSNGYTNYAAIHCFNGTADSTRNITLSGGTGDYARSSGHIKVVKDGIVGRVCPLYWGDSEAKVVCRSLNFSNGLSYSLTNPLVGPFMLTEISCVGSESSIWQCPVGNATCSQSNFDAGAFCFNDEAPQVQIVGGTSDNRGRVEIVYRGEIGTVCIPSSYWSDLAARVVCRNLPGRSWVTGIATRGTAAVTTGRIALSGVLCNGNENSLFSCRNRGFMTQSADDCEDHTGDLEVVCMDEVDLISSSSTNVTLLGIVWLFKDNLWNYVCGDLFDDVDAGVICRKMGYSYSRALPKGALGRRYYYNNIFSSVNCTGNEASFGSCPMAQGGCQNTDNTNYASVFCSKVPITRGVQAMMPVTNPGWAVVQVDGILSTVCSRGWDSTDAAIYCRDLGFLYGRMAGALYDVSSLPKIVFNMTCRGNEGSIAGCLFSTNPSADCSYYETARVFCYNNPSDYQVRLIGGEVSYEGNVEVGIMGKWGAVCDSNAWTTQDASVVCRELNYKGGVVVSSGTFSSQNNFFWILNARCGGMEDGLIACPFSYFNSTYYSSIYGCTNRRAAVRCTGEVKLLPNKTYGALQMLVNSTSSHYGLVCSDGFGSKEAAVACRQLGLPYGLPFCCSAFGDIDDATINITRLQCSGREAALRDCSYSFELCQSHKYASVVCSNLSPSSGYSVRLEKFQSDLPYGVVRVTHMGYPGYLCADGFDNKDANVICKEAGYAGGIGFNHYNFRRGLHSDILWLSNIDCDGTESYLSSCRNVVWGNVTKCSSQGDAAVFCYQNTAPRLKLVNGTSTIGRLELWTEDMRGTICGLHWSNYEAAAACASMGFNGGKNLDYGYYGQGTGDVLIDTVYCNGAEQSLFNCYLELKGSSEYSFCNNNHQYDAAVQCFNATRIVGPKLPYYGRVEMFSNGTWVAVCDRGFDLNAARVVCRALGYTEARPQCCSVLGESPHIGLVVNRCDGSESSLLNCDVSASSACPTRKYASVLCSNQPIQEQRLQVQLIESVYDSSRPYLGTVLANRYGFYGPVCNSSWDDKDANATCHGLNYTYGISFYGRDKTAMPVVLGKFNCSGLEASLASCPFSDIDDDINCSFSLFDSKRQDAGVLCYNNPQGVKIRLQDGGERYGRIEIQFDGNWGRVVDNLWTNNDATIACKQLGFMNGRPSPYSLRTNHPDRSSKIWMRSVDCDGDERTLMECFSFWDYQTYWLTDANVICYNNVRLTGGNQFSTGVVEVNINGKWGSVCGTGWSERNTEVACKNLGFDNGFHVCCEAFGTTYYPLMDDVVCSGTDTDLTMCSHNVPTSQYCNGASIAAVACYKGPTPTAFTYRLNPSGNSNNTGEVIITFMNITGRICSDGWDNNDAKVFCSELGFEHGVAYEHYFYSYSYDQGPYWTTNVNCRGSEQRLRDCQISMGHVHQCSKGRGAGVLCTNVEGIFYDLETFGTSVTKGRVRVSVDGVWGTVCRSGFWYYAASAFCRGQGFTEGMLDYSSDQYPNPPSRIYESSFSCRGGETSLEQCAHTGLAPATSSYCTHAQDVKVICFNDVSIGGAYDPSIRQGPVQLYKNGTWYNLCDAGFDDVTARRVCQDLDFVDGKALCCSAYGSYSYYTLAFDVHLNYSMHCQGGEASATQCIRPVNDNACTSGSYASVVCFRSGDFVDESTYAFNFVDPSKPHGTVAVTHMNITGRVCNTNWTDEDAKVMCRSKGHRDGLAYHYSQWNYDSFSSRGPFWVSNINCTGSETSLDQCPFSDRLHLGNCSQSDLASALCFNDTGLQFRLNASASKPWEGRVEMAVGGVWGTICSSYFDDLDARVFCRQQGYKDGYMLSTNPLSSLGSGPLWLSGLHCTGMENSLIKCPHDGLLSDVAYDGWFYSMCSSHYYDDAYVACVDKLKLNTGYPASMGALMVYQNNGWKLVCDSGLDHTDSQVACRELGYSHGTFVTGSVFGAVPEATIGIASVRCRGTESSFSNCTFDLSTSCRSQKYSSVVCGHEPFIESNPKLRLVLDNPDDPRHGYLEYQVDGVWGSVCGSSFTKNEANVACRQLNFNGGVPYAPKWTNAMKPPILISDLQCFGNEVSLEVCKKRTAAAWCDYFAPRAGVLCFNDTNNNLTYRLTGDESNLLRGRFEMSYMGQFGFFCVFHPSAAARVACRSMQFADGFAIQGRRYGTNAGDPIWLLNADCKGNESSILECNSAGFNMSDEFFWMEDYCRNSIGAFSVQCYRQQLAVTQIRLVGGSTNSSGRVELYLQGPNQWGTVCDDLWDDIDATVVCNQLGYATGKAEVRAGFGEGVGSIWMDTVGCTGTETRIQDCEFQGWSIHDCSHSEDSGVICSGKYVPPATTTTTATTSKPAGRVIPTQKSSEAQTNAPGTPQYQSADSGSSTDTAAIVAPIVVIVVLVAAAAAGFVLYRRRRADPGNLEILTPEGPVSSSSLTFGRGGVVQFMNRVKGNSSGKRKDVQGGETTMEGLSNPVYGNTANVAGPSFEASNKVNLSGDQMHVGYDA